MKKLTLIFIFYSLLVKAHSQVNNYYDAIKEGNKEFAKGEYKKAINYYFAAAAFQPENKGEVKEKVNKAFAAIEALRKKAEDALADAEKQKKIAQQALKKNIEFLNKDVGKKYQGGIIFYADSSRDHGLIAAERDFEKSTLDSTFNWEEAKKACEDYAVTVDGKMYDDWHLPSLRELALLYNSRDRVGGLRIFNYWSSVPDTDITRAWYINFFNGGQFNAANYSLNCVRPVRAF